MNNTIMFDKQLSKNNESVSSNNRFVESYCF